MNKLLAYSLRCSNDLSPLDLRAERAVAMAAYMWLLLVPILMLSSIEPLSQWCDIDGRAARGIAVATGIGLLLAARYFLVGCLSWHEPTAVLLVRCLPIALVVSALFSVAPGLYYIGGVTDWTDSLGVELSKGQLQLSLMVIALIVALNAAAVVSVIFSTSFLREVRLREGDGNNSNLHV